MSHTPASRIDWLEVADRIEANMAKEQRRLNECQTKQKFKSASDAMRRLTRDRKGKVGAYRCEFCGQFHLGGALMPRAVRVRLHGKEG